MKNKILFGSFAVFVLILFVFGCFMLENNHKSKAKATISNDYSQIYYDNNLYVPYLEWEENGVNVSQFPYTIMDVVVNNRFFIWDIFLTDYIHVSSDEKVIYLETDYDLLESNYYKLEE